jgi:hypothetical protein
VKKLAKNTIFFKEIKKINLKKFLFELAERAYFRRKKDVNFLISLPSKPHIVQKTQRRFRDFLLKKIFASLSRAADFWFFG